MRSCFLFAQFRRHLVDMDLCFQVFAHVFGALAIPFGANFASLWERDGREVANIGRSL
jgi:hypothetical protein